MRTFPIRLTEKQADIVDWAASHMRQLGEDELSGLGYSTDVSSAYARNGRTDLIIPISKEWLVDLRYRLLEQLRDMVATERTSQARADFRAARNAWNSIQRIAERHGILF